jgi:hypothetical protein
MVTNQQARYEEQNVNNDEVKQYELYQVTQLRSVQPGSRAGSQDGPPVEALALGVLAS